MAAPPPAPTRAAWRRLFQRGRARSAASECSHPATGLEQNLGELEFGARRAARRRRATRRSSRPCWSGARARGAARRRRGRRERLHAAAHAARNGHAGCVALLLRHRAAVDAATSGGDRLHRAAFCGHEAIVRALLAARASATLQDADGEAPLHKAAAESHEGGAAAPEAAPAARRCATGAAGRRPSACPSRRGAGWRTRQRRWL